MVTLLAGSQSYGLQCMVHFGVQGLCKAAQNFGLSKTIAFVDMGCIKATRGLLGTDHVILNHGQVTWTTPELAPPLLTTTPTGGRFSSRQI
ncbi:hypothetical protein TNCV_3254771 [Trichonephila clavipes]|nr:hypothetical protein TNCV_3254771 [Trichonephila clavipes]